MKQESHSSSSSSSSPSSPTVSKIQMRERQDGVNSETSPVQLPTLVDDDQGNLMKPKPTKTPKTSKGNHDRTGKPV